MAKPKFSRTALEVLRKRYLLKDSRGNVIETPEQMFRRVANIIASVDAKYGADSEKSKKDFYEMLSSLDFLPNSPTLMNAGTKIHQLAACFVIPVGDSMQGIFDAIKYMALIHQSGGGTGFSFSSIRPEGDIISTSKGIASGPLSFMKIFDSAADIIKQGGRRRGANMGILHAEHPDIMKFIGAKSRGGLQNFNISVGASDSFMESVKKGNKISLVNPRTGKEASKIPARKIFSSMVENAWGSGEPGVVFLDEINRKHPVPGKIESTNHCGEQPLLPFESCNLGSINLSHMVSGKEVDWKKLGETARTAVRFLDNVIDASTYPLPQTEKATMLTRKIGLGVMGFAEMLIKIGVRYDSKEAEETAGKVMEFINSEARKASEGIGKRRGSFPLFSKSKLKKKYKTMRNATVTTIAPTGSISIIAGTSSGIEPLYAVKFSREILGGKKFVEVSPLYKSGAYPKKLFVTAMEVKPEQHVRIQAALQSHTDNAVSKTVNLPANATKEDVRKVYMLAYELKCKGITVYRHKSRESQVFTCITC